VPDKRYCAKRCLHEGLNGKNALLIRNCALRNYINKLNKRDPIVHKLQTELSELPGLAESSLPVAPYGTEMKTTESDACGPRESDDQYT
jgi:hypothetical protein